MGSCTSTRPQKSSRVGGNDVGAGACWLPQGFVNAGKGTEVATGVMDRLSVTMSAGRETRKEFVRRLRNAVAWVNANRYEHMQHLCESQKERAREVLT